MSDSITLSSRLFLGVQRSALGLSWRDRLDANGQARALAIAQLQGHGDILSRILAGRGVGPETSEDYLDPSLRRLLPDPHCLKDMDAAADRIAHAVERGDKIAIFGDYDVDGAASSALLADYFEACGILSVVYIPDRIFEGYGPNIAAIQTLAAAGAKLLITVDCGTMSYAPLVEARRLGLDPIVIDHHQAPETLPDALVVNPNRQDDLSQLGQLCAAGVVFMTLIALNRNLRARGFFSFRPEPDLLAGLDLVSLATIADVAPLSGLNRAFVTKGLAVMRRRARPGLAALFDVAKIDGPPRPYHLGFLIGPRINAGGRIGDAALGARLLSIADPADARRIAEELDRLNRERQVLEGGTVEEAEAQALARLGADDVGAAILVASDDWHPGVVGLVASRLKDKFRRPAFAIAFAPNGGSGTGSGRSIPGVDLGFVVREAVEAEILVKGGGHAMAAGITIRPERVEDFRAFLEIVLAKKVAEGRAEQALLIDAALTAAGATPTLVKALERAGPYGSGNAEPVFALPAHRLLDVSEVGAGHIRLRAQAGDGAKIDGIAFRASGQPLEHALRAARGAMVHLAGTLALDQWGGAERVQLRLLDIARVDQRVA
ncbi:Single-stranded-DNA-specific exonuclease RecJ [Methylocella tundrae]|uniref:Single-stranded-DNA-specific exonuclease RecJ n=1 Tax=Methylocella tundrae TaxID=227605 RepID=A0A8B6M320_METTU|nr:single-stranded-DNA-specific exonuclease RecJ [Methylocella tundrae]VTZ49236.1 Single-stranded-DNA-specific exonuclease RecJ [Methylocella tundrae]